MSVEDARDLQDLCRDYNITVIPQLNVMAHCLDLLTLQKFSHLAEHSAGQDWRTSAGNTLCATSLEVRRFIDALLADVFDVFESPIVHVGGDEVALLGECPRCQKRTEHRDKLDLYVAYLDRIRGLAARRGRRIGIWGDVLLNHHLHAPLREFRELIAPMREGAIIYDWHYDGASRRSLEFFVGEGFATVASSTTALYAAASPWPAQAQCLREFYADAIAAGAFGALTTSWENYAGLHEEHGNYLFAASGAAVWSGPEGLNLANFTTAEFEKAYALDRYGLRTDTLWRYLHAMGDLRGPVLGPLAPLNAANVRRCVYHSDNPLSVWQQYAPILKGAKLAQYRRALRQGRQLWQRLLRQVGAGDPYLHLHEGSLLTHEHLLKRLEMGERLYQLYDRAAEAQFKNPRRFVQLLRQAAAMLRAHQRDYDGVEKYLEAAHRELGMERASLRRIGATRKKTLELAGLLGSFATGRRPLPAFVLLGTMFLDQTRSAFYGEREHEWVEGPARFRRYSLASGPVVCELDSLRKRRRGVNRRCRHCRGE